MGRKGSGDYRFSVKPIPVPRRPDIMFFTLNSRSTAIWSSITADDEAPEWDYPTSKWTSRKCEVTDTYVRPLANNYTGTMTVLYLILFL